MEAAQTTRAPIARSRGADILLFANRIPELSAGQDLLLR
jgi:hypothetical protein